MRGSQKNARASTPLPVAQGRVQPEESREFLLQSNVSRGSGHGIAPLS